MPERADIPDPSRYPRQLISAEIKPGEPAQPPDPSGHLRKPVAVKVETGKPAQVPQPLGYFSQPVTVKTQLSKVAETRDFIGHMSQLEPAEIEYLAAVAVRGFYPKFGCTRVRRHGVRSNIEDPYMDRLSKTKLLALPYAPQPLLR